MQVNVKIFYFSVFRKGSISLFFDHDATVFDALSELNDKFGDDFEKETGKNLMKSFGTYFNIFVNGKHLELPLELGHILTNEDQLIILRPVSGG